VNELRTETRSFGYVSAAALVEKICKLF